VNVLPISHQFKIQNSKFKIKIKISHDVSFLFYLLLFVLLYQKQNIIANILMNTKLLYDVPVPGSATIKRIFEEAIVIINYCCYLSSTVLYSNSFFFVILSMHLCEIVCEFVFSMLIRFVRPTRRVTFLFLSFTSKINVCNVPSFLHSSLFCFHEMSKQ
jgi:hypothetical protein